MRTLVVHPGSLGDQVVASWPLAVLRGEGAEVHLASRGPLGAWLRARGSLASWTDLDGPLGADLIEGKLESWPGAPIQRVVLLRADPDGALAGRLARAGVSAVVESSRSVRGALEPVRHRVARLLGVAPTDPDGAWLADPEARAGARRVGAAGATVLLHPGSGGLDKCWPRDAFAELAALLERDGQSVVWGLGPAELERGVRAPEGATSVALGTLSELASRVAAASGYVGCDSGATHFAVACGVPAVVLFGPSSVRDWGWELGWVRNLVGVVAAGSRWGLAPARARAALFDAMLHPRVA